MLRGARPAGGAEHDWAHGSLEHQRPPAGDWTLWLLLGGRGAGKTRAGAEWIRAFVRERTDPARIALVSETYADGREVMIEGQSGLAHIGPPNERPTYEPSRRRIVFPRNGSVAYVFSSEDPDGLRGHQFHAAWGDELCKWKHAEETWSNLQLALRLGRRPRQVVTTTPRPIALLKRLLAAPTTAASHATTYANAENLSPAFLGEIAAAYEGTALGRQELFGEIIEDVAGALWTRAMIEAARIHVPPDFHQSLDRIVVAVDPPASAGEAADECGIVVAGVLRGASRGEATAFVLADRSEGGLSPRRWAEKAVAAFREFKADRILVETNQGGDMVREIVRGVDGGVPVKEVRATRGKRLRAEPVAALYEQGLVRHIGSFAKLEDQMATFTGEGAASPDRLDALVWALWELMLRPAAEPRITRIGQESFN
ncbi:MAG: DNA-packaging protein [Parvularculaceae bacterium]|nr:DNA-packaging protein [Parvularculaceae bacterium]